MHIYALVFIICLFANPILSGTYSYDREYERILKANAVPINDKQKNDIRTAITVWAFVYLDKKYSYKEKVKLTNSVSKEEKTFTMDCSGFVAATYWSANIVVFDKQAVFGPSGTTTIYKTLSGFDKIFKKDPARGDIVFFDKTTNKETPLSHTGVIVDIDENETITFIHAGSGGLAKGYMNLKYPNEHKKDNVIINSYIRNGVGIMGLTSKCFNSFGSVFDTSKK